MMIKTNALRRWVQSAGWFWAFVFSVIACALVYLVNRLFATPQPYTIWGLAYGTAAAVFMVGAAAWGVRRRMLRKAPARSQAWVQFHVYGGTLFLLLVLMHTGFHWPTGGLTWWLYIFAIWIAVSGFIGVTLQKVIPRILTSGLSIEVNYNRIPELIDDVRQKSEELAKNCPEAVQDFYTKTLAPAMSGPKPRLIYFLDITGGIQSSLKQFEYLRRFLNPEEKEKLNHLQAYYKAKLEMDAHYTLQKALRVWLYFHLPVSLILILLLGMHLYTVFYY
jgi:hypothetical protein